MKLKSNTKQLFAVVMLIAGSSIGAGMLAMPTVAGLFGIKPALIFLTLSCAYMYITGALLVELYFRFSQDRANNLISLGHKTLGLVGKIIIIATFLYLFLSLIVAYLAKGGELLNVILPATFPASSGAIILTGVTLLLVAFDLSVLDMFNRICMLGLFGIFGLMIAMAITHANVANLSYVRWAYSYAMVPLMVTAFGFHNILATVKKEFKLDFAQLLKACLYGSLLPLLIYALWLVLTQSIVPLLGEYGIVNSYLNDRITSEPLGQIIGSPYMGACAQIFAFFAIVTSLITQAISICDFILDGLGYKINKYSRLLIGAIVLLPALLLSQYSVKIFILALELAGLFAALTLFGILPPVMCWVSRYSKKFAPYTSPEIVGGKPLLLIIAIIPIILMGLKLSGKMHIDVSVFEEIGMSTNRRL
jgi:tyrosine-specific transport protein